MSDAGKGDPSLRTSERPPDQPGFDDAVGALKGVLQTYEVQVLGIVGLLIGYICVFFAKILAFTNIYMGLFGVGLITLLLIVLQPNYSWKDYRNWLRSIAVIIISLVLTGPQLYFAWTVLVDEVRAALALENQRNAEARATQQVNPSIVITK